MPEEKYYLEIRLLRRSLAAGNRIKNCRIDTIILLV
jgi:hypothetical protein